VIFVTVPQFRYFRVLSYFVFKGRKQNEQKQTKTFYNAKGGDIKWESVRQAVEQRPRQQGGSTIRERQTQELTNT
jgi:hypothetical protein